MQSKIWQFMKKENINVFDNTFERNYLELIVRLLKKLFFKRQLLFCFLIFILIAFLLMRSFLIYLINKVWLRESWLQRHLLS